MAAETRIEVTQEDIDKGRRFRAQDCPLARAISRAFNGRYTSVGARGFSIEDSPRYILPPEVYAFRRAFDDGEPVQPITFYVKVPGGPTL
jgi:hypothetical protein